MENERPNALYEWRECHTRRAEAPALCYHCGKEIDDVMVALYGSFCSGACVHATRTIDPWLANGDVR